MPYRVKVILRVPAIVPSMEKPCQSTRTFCLLTSPRAPFCIPSTLRVTSQPFDGEGNEMTHNPGFLKLVEQAKRNIRECTAADVKAKMDRGETFQFIDVREDQEFGKDHAKGAVHLGRGIIE